MTEDKKYNGPYDKFESAFEAFQKELRQEITETLNAFKQEILEAIRHLATGEPFDAAAFRSQLVRDMQEQLAELQRQDFDPDVFRDNLLEDIQQKFDEFKEELAVSLEGAKTLPQFAHSLHESLTDEPKKQSWLDRPLSDFLNKNLFK